MSYRNRLLVLPDSGEDYSGRRRRHQRHFWTTASFITATPDFSVVHIHENGDLRDSAEVLSTGSVRNTTEPRRGSIRQAERGIRTNPLIGWCAIFSRPLVEVDHKYTLSNNCTLSTNGLRSKRNGQGMLGERYRISLQTVHEIMYRQVAVHPMIAMPEGLDGRWAFAVVTAGR
ncbi:hypothetical protein T4C_10240 [Trichinella pseudospiralis]|uniref:Uncharacterized protein n=1 Tax=Trichinella pseudospiralis TaxID=6337 RepID=A0A0V1JYR4_TRIPS|nr:hypothetical protein T4C_10240 [Trichinella pseudospiralis]